MRDAAVQPGVLNVDASEQPGKAAKLTEKSPVSKGEETKAKGNRIGFMAVGS
jgi:hypothetical protein